MLHSVGHHYQGGVETGSIQQEVAGSAYGPSCEMFHDIDLVARHFITLSTSPLHKTEITSQRKNVYHYCNSTDKQNPQEKNKIQE